MTNIKNAFDYHKELSELQKLVDSIKYTLEYVDGAMTHVEDPASILAMSLSLAQADLNKSLEFINARFKDVKQKLESSYF